jgi:hypothetical protein
MKLSEYILLPREQRITHIDLSTPCDPQGTKARNNKQTILDFLGVVNNIPNWITAKVQRCHACSCDSQRGWCANPLHYYLGTTAENVADHRVSDPDYTNPFAPGMGQYINEDGEVEVMRCEEAKARGLKSAVKGTPGYGAFFDPDTGTNVFLPVEEAKARGLRGSNTGKAQFRDPETNELVVLPVEEGRARGWKGNQNGQSYPKQRCPHCGRMVGSNSFGQYHGVNCVERVGSDRWLAAEEKRAGVALSAEERAFVTAWA